MQSPSIRYIKDLSFPNGQTTCLLQLSLRSAKELSIIIIIIEAIEPTKPSLRYCTSEKQQ